MSLTWHASSHNPGYWLALAREEGTVTLAPVALSWLLTRRALFSLGAAAVSGLAAGWPRGTLAEPTVGVAPPTLVRGAHCTATVSVQVTLDALAPGMRYDVSGELWEADDPDGEPDFCCTLNPQQTTPGTEGTHRLVLTREAMAAELGLVKGIGPASDETSSADLVELFARVWLHDLATGDRSGPWESPRRVAVASGALDWTRARTFPGSELMVPRGNRTAPTHDGISLPLPLQACLG